MKKKILIFSSSYKFYKIFLSPIEKIISKNNKVYVLTNLENSKPSLKNENIYNINISRKIDILNDIVCLLKIILIFLKLRPDLLITSTPKGIVVGIFLKIIFFWKKRIHIYTGINWYNKKGIKRFFLKFIDKINFFFSDEIFFDGQNQISFFKKNNFQIDKCKLISQGSIKGVDTNLFKKNDEQYKKFRIDNYLKDDSIVLLYLGRIDPEKGIFFLLECFNQISSSLDNIILVICGTSEMDIENIIDCNFQNIKNDIILLKHSDEPEKILQIADILCLPSEREGFGNIVIEASSCQVPVIGTNISGLDDSLIHNINGFKYELANKEQFNYYLLKLITDKVLRLRLGNQGRQFVQNKFNKNIVLEDFYKMIESNL